MIGERAPQVNTLHATGSVGLAADGCDALVTRSLEDARGFAPGLAGNPSRNAIMSAGEESEALLSLLA